jgi:hypothetical protein
MKALKISLAVIVLAAIAVGICKWIYPPTDGEGGLTPPPPSVENQFTKRIEQEIASIGQLPDNKFCKDFYNEITYYINDYHKQNRLGPNRLGNDQMKDELSIKLDSAYIPKFIRQTRYVFDGSEWKIEDLIFIRNECQSLRNSKWLETGSPKDKELAEIQTVFSKYDEIVGFISSCKRFSYSGTDLTDRFPVNNVKSNILRAETYRNNRLGNGHLNHCTRLHDGLKEIPQALFRAHVRYLDRKIDYWSGLYPNYNSHSDYTNILYKPLRSEIDALDNNIYPVSNFNSERKRLFDKWSADNIEAYNYFSQQIKEEIR